MEEWRQSFHDIYGRSPTAADISIAPNHIKVLLQKQEKMNKIEEPEKQTKKGVKRKNFGMKMMDDEQFSPIKKRVNLKKFKGDEESEEQLATRVSPRKKPFSLDDSPVKSLSPRKNAKPSTSSVRFEFDDFSPMKSYSGDAAKPVSMVKSALTPIKSPTKKAYQRKLFNRDLEMLLLPTPEKGAEIDEGPVEEFDDETTEDIASAKAQKPVVRRLGGAKKSDQNFQKINLRKKQFVRGKVTAEQKRKLKRKQMFRKKN